MFRLWGKLFWDNRLLADTTVCNDDIHINRTKKIFAALDTICHDFDLSTPIWLESNISDFKKNSKTRFYQDNFIEEIDFDYLEVQVIEEDD